MANDYLKNFGHNLKRLRNNKNWSQEELAHRAQLDRTYISMLERGVRNPTLAIMEDLSKALDVDLTALLKGSGPQSSKGPAKASRPLFYGTSVSCGRPVASEDVIEKEISLDEWVIKKAESTFFIKAIGDSMEPTIFHHDLLMVEQHHRPKDGEIVLLRLDGEFSVKRLKKNSKDKDDFEADNPFYQNISAKDYAEVIICGVIKAIIRTGL